MSATTLQLTLATLGILNATSLTAYWLDKCKARRGKPRISEARLLQLSLLGPLGSIPGIWWLRHKTRKPSYLLKYLAVMILSLALHIAAGCHLLLV